MLMSFDTKSIQIPESSFSILIRLFRPHDNARKDISSTIAQSSEQLELHDQKGK